ncbi:MAG: hypothetical protein JWN52_2770 [Actinomycetia bacterium]|nr:hypothetical protein [Actinomycetes bacterium]
MSPMPVDMADRWADRREPAPGEGLLYWHILLHDHPPVQALARRAQDRLPAFPGLHLVPSKWLHITTLVVGPTDAITAEQADSMVAEAARLLAGIPPINVRFGRILYHPQAVMLGVKPGRALDPVFHAVRAATRHATSRDGIVDHQPWTPHATLAYSTQVQPAAPIIAALGRELPNCETNIGSVSLVAQEGPERLWDWHPIATIPFGSPPSPILNGTV